MARARPTRLRIPPLRLSGILAFSPWSSTTSSTSLTRARIALTSCIPASRSGNAIFSSTVMESKSAPLWKRMPTFCRILVNCRSLIPIMFLPETQISPASGCIKPMRCLSKTDLPPPLRPIITSVSPTATSRSTPRKICSSPMALRKSRTAIIAPLSVTG